MLLKKNTKFIVIILFCIILFTLNLITSKNISPVVKPSYKFDFQNFLMFTFLVNLVVYLVKIVFIYCIIRLSFFVFDIVPKTSVISVIIIAEIIKLLIVKGLKIFTFYALDKKMTLEYFKTFEDKYSFYELFKIDLIDFKYLINFIDVFDIIYISIIVSLFVVSEKMKTVKVIKVVALPYALTLFLLGIVKTFMSL